MNNLIKNNRLIDRNPALAKQYHPVKNNISVDNISFSSKKLVWWICDYGHEWQATVHNRNRSKKSLCPQCNSLFLIKPDLLQEWNYSKNSIDPSKVSPFSTKKAWWVCKKGHEWQDKICKRSLGFGECRECNSLLFKFPDIAKEWHPLKNPNLSPQKVNYGSNLTVWWQCRNGHEWKTLIGSRTSKNRQCPFCTHQKVYDEISLSFLNPNLAKQWHPIKNGILTPLDVTSSSAKKVWWICNICKSEWQSTVNSRSNHRSCPFCDGKKVNNTNSLEALNPELASEWNYFRNKLTPANIASGSGRLFWWVCKNGHEWQASPATRKTNAKDSNGNGCPFCCSRYAYSDNCLSTIDPNLAKQWHPIKNGDLLPNNVTAGSGKKVWWKCEKGHEWEAQIGNRSKQHQGCPLCQCLAIQNPELSKEWNYNKNGLLTPYDISPHNSKKVWWTCRNGHDFLSTVGSRSYGSGCPKCWGILLNDDTHCQSLLEAYFYLKFKHEGKVFSHNKKYPMSNYRYDFYFPGDNKYLEVTRYDSRVCRWWKQYMDKILKKKDLVENKLNASFEFIQRTLTKKETKWVKSFAK